MKPTNWKECPGSVLENFLWNLDLEYCRYEGSKVETIHSIMNDFIGHDNEKIIYSAWAMVSEETFKTWCKSQLEQLQNQQAQLEQYLA